MVVSKAPYHIRHTIFANAESPAEGSNSKHPNLVVCSVSIVLVYMLLYFQVLSSELQQSVATDQKMPATRSVSLGKHHATRRALMTNLQFQIARPSSKPG